MANALSSVGLTLTLWARSSAMAAAPGTDMPAEWV
jgi:hypothetical protein